MLQTLLEIAGLLIALVGLIISIIGTEELKKNLFTIIFPALILTSGISLFLFFQHESDVARVKAEHAREIARVKEEIIRNLSNEGITFDDLYQSIYPEVSHEFLREALYEQIEERSIGYRPIRVQYEGKPMSVRVFYKR